LYSSQFFELSLSTDLYASNLIEMNLLLDIPLRFVCMSVYNSKHSEFHSDAFKNLPPPSSAVDREIRFEGFFKI
jgi:hypothetical protein